MVRNPVGYIIYGVRDSRTITFDWFANIFELERASRFLEAQGYATKAWLVSETNKREQLW